MSHSSSGAQKRQEKQNSWVFILKVDRYSYLATPATGMGRGAFRGDVCRPASTSSGARVRDPLPDLWLLFLSVLIPAVGGTPPLRQF